LVALPQQLGEFTDVRGLVDNENTDGRHYDTGCVSMTMDGRHRTQRQAVEYKLNPGDVT
jgi:hypothetical protein